MSKESTWNGNTNLTESNRPLTLSRPCPCGCDTRGGKKGVGYISGSVKGKGFTIWIESEEIFKRVEAVFTAENLTFAG